MEGKSPTLNSFLKCSNEQKHKKLKKKKKNTKEECLGEILEELEKDLSYCKLITEKKKNWTVC